MSSTSTSYDEVLYPSYVHAQTHPDRIAAIATLFGMQPAPVQTSRVLELACGQGGNLIPIACSYPESQCLGIDLAQRQVEKGQEVVDALGLPNIELRYQSILDFPIDAGRFDYIIAHGVFSWVPADVRDKILAICQDHLAPSGVAFVSYNTYPGWHQRRMIRDMMRFHTRTLEEPSKRIEQAKAFLTFMNQAIPEGSAYAKSLREEYGALAHADESYLFHEQLEEVNEPQYFHEFAEQAQSHELQYVSEIEFSNLQFDRYPPQVAQALRKMEILMREQYLDFLMRRTFRQTLLCHNGVPLDRTNLPGNLTKLRVATPAVSSGSKPDLRQGVPVAFVGLGGVQANVADSLTKAAFLRLGAAWPQSIPFGELESMARKDVAGDSIVVQDETQFQRDTDLLADHLLRSFVMGTLQLHTRPASLTTRVTGTPQACPLARYQAEPRYQDHDASAPIGYPRSIDVPPGQTSGWSDRS